MINKKLTHNYHDSHLESFSLGPRKEIKLFIKLDAVWNPNSPENVSLRFGGIKNFNEVKDFFSSIEKQNERDFICEIEGIDFEYKSKWIINLDIYGSITVESTKCEEI